MPPNENPAPDKLYYGDPQGLHLTFEGDLSLASGYTSRTQQARRITEDWIARNGYCLRCDSDQLTPTTANTRTRDFACGTCGHGYELKSKLGTFSNRVLDGAYGAMIRTIRKVELPRFCSWNTPIFGQFKGFARSIIR